jgi:ABC-type Fe3+ transport system substrate-binding protein
VHRLADGFNRHYGLNLRVEYTPGPDHAQMSARIAQEYQAGRPASSDIFLGADSTIAVLLRADALAPVDWLSWATHIGSPEQVAPNGVGVTVQTYTPGITYNSSRVIGDAVPRSLQDLLKPEYRGRILRLLLRSPIRAMGEGARARVRNQAIGSARGADELQ